MKPIFKTSPRQSPYNSNNKFNKAIRLNELKSNIKRCQYCNVAVTISQVETKYTCIPCEESRHSISQLSKYHKKFTKGVLKDKTSKISSSLKKAKSNSNLKKIKKDPYLESTDRLPLINSKSPSRSTSPIRHNDFELRTDTPDLEVQIINQKLDSQFNNNKVKNKPIMRKNYSESVLKFHEFVNNTQIKLDKQNNNTKSSHLNIQERKDWLDKISKPKEQKSIELNDSYQPNITQSVMSYNLWAKVSKDPKNDPKYDPYNRSQQGFYKNRFDKLHRGERTIDIESNRKKYGASMTKNYEESKYKVIIKGKEATIRPRRENKIEERVRSQSIRKQRPFERKSYEPPNFKTTSKNTLLTRSSLLDEY